MSLETVQGTQYFRPPHDAPWRWEEDGLVLSWSDGSTIAFRDEILEVLKALAPQGLPPFPNVALLLASCRGKVPTAMDSVGTGGRLGGRRPGPASEGSAEGATGAAGVTNVVAALIELRRVAGLPPGLRQSLRAKIMLAQAVFETAAGPRLEPRFPLKPEFWTSLPDEAFLPQQAGSGTSWVQSLRQLACGIRPHTSESLELRMRTGLDRLPGPAGIDLSPSLRARRLLDELLGDPEQEALSRATRGFMAALRLPHQLSQAEDSAVGGVADLSNRGPIDRLLLSELAHDDETLTARIALNEALYLKREPPGHEPPVSLDLLVDCGIRLWGLPRVLATAAALATIANETHATEVRVYTPSSGGIQPEDLLSLEGVTRQLGRLDCAAHPGDCLPTFQESRRDRPSTRSLLVTHADVLADPEFRRALSASPRAIDFIATVDHHGRLALHPPPFTRHLLTFESKIDPATLFSDSLPGRVPAEAAVHEHLPAFLRVHPTPLLLPLTGRVDNWAPNPPDSVVAVLEDRRLVEFGAGRGARVLAPKLPAGSCLWVEKAGSRIHLVKAGSHHRPNRLVTLENGRAILSTDLCMGDPATGATRVGDVLLLMRDRDVFAYSLETGQLMDRKISPSRWHRGRFYASGRQFHAVHWDGGNIQFSTVPLPASLSGQEIVAMFDREGQEGPWVATHLCQVMSLATGERCQIPLPIGQSSHARNLVLSRDGHRVLISIPKLGWTGLFALGSGKPEAMHPGPSPMDTLHADPILPGPGLQASQEAVHIHNGRDLLLRSRKGRWMKLVLDDEQRTLTWKEVPFPGHESGTPFEPDPSFPPPPGNPGVSLTHACLGPSHRAILDSRGLLHLGGTQAGGIDITLCLTGAETAAWCAAPAACGPEFFLPVGTESDYRCIAGHLRTWLASVQPREVAA